MDCNNLLKQIGISFDLQQDLVTLKKYSLGIPPQGMQFNSPKFNFQGTVLVDNLKNNELIKETKILKKLESLMLTNKVPLLFPIIYISYTISNSYIVIVQKYGISSNLFFSNASDELLIHWLFQLARGLQSLSQNNIMYGNTSVDNIKIQYVNYKNNDLAILFTNFFTSQLDNNTQQTILVNSHIFQKMVEQLPQNRILGVKESIAKILSESLSLDRIVQYLKSLVS